MLGPNAVAGYSYHFYYYIVNIEDAFIKHLPTTYYYFSSNGLVRFLKGSSFAANVGALHYIIPRKAEIIFK